MHSSYALIDVLGSNYSGWLISDCLATYDSPLFPKKAKCVGHFLKSLSDLEALHMKPKELPSAKQEKRQGGKGISPLAPSPTSGAGGALQLAMAQNSTEEDHLKFPEQAKSILAMALNLKHSQPELLGEIYEATRSVIHHLLDNLLSEEITEPNNLRLANRMRKHRKAMLAFLDP